MCSFKKNTEIICISPLSPSDTTVAKQWYSIINQDIDSNTNYRAFLLLKGSLMLPFYSYTSLFKIGCFSITEL